MTCTEDTREEYTWRVFIEYTNHRREHSKRTSYIPPIKSKLVGSYKRVDLPKRGAHGEHQEH